MAAGGRTGSNRFVPIRADLNGSAAPDSRKSALQCAGSWPVVCRIFGGRIDAGKCFAPSRGCVTRFPAVKRGFRPGSAHFNNTIQPVFQAYISESTSGVVCRPAFHISCEPARYSSMANAFACGRARAPLFKQTTKAQQRHPLPTHQSSQGHALACTASRRRIVAARAFRQAGLVLRGGRPAHALLIYPAFIPGRWPRWCTPLARRPDFPARRAISAFSTLPRR